MRGCIFSSIRILHHVYPCLRNGLHQANRIISRRQTDVHLARPLPPFSIALPERETHPTIPGAGRGTKGRQEHILVVAFVALMGIWFLTLLTPPNTRLFNEYFSQINSAKTWQPKNPVYTRLAECRGCRLTIAADENLSPSPFTRNNENKSLPQIDGNTNPLTQPLRQIEEPIVCQRAQHQNSTVLYALLLILRNSGPTDLL